MKISVNCPSYKRSFVETLDYLPFCQVWVDEGEYMNYYEDNAKWATIISCKSGIQGNLCRIRNHILRTEFDKGMDVVCLIDDDMKGVYYWEQMTDHKVEKEHFLGFLEKYSLLAQEFGAFFWGINVNIDKQVYREYSPFSTVSYIGGPFQVFLKGNECFYDERLYLKEDYDMTLQQLNRYRMALRVNKFHYNVKQSQQAGGCAAYRNLEVEEMQMNLLIKKWGANIVKWDGADRSHNLKRSKRNIDYNPLIYPPIRGI
jgi:hypothetical protein